MWAKTASTPTLLITPWKFPQKGTTPKTQTGEVAQRWADLTVFTLPADS